VINISKHAVAAVLAAAALALPAVAQAAPSHAEPQKLALATATADHAVSGGAARYDGSWSVVIQTTRGECPAATRAGIHIVGGKLEGNAVVYQIDGRVAADGAIRVTVTAGGKSANGSGRLSNQAGSGVWRTSLGECSGQWTAERRS
jgi:hypothetical protein